MDEQHTAARAADIVGNRPPVREPFDPANLLDGRKPPPLPYTPGPTVVVVREFDPASFLGDRALRGAFNLSTVKPLVTTVGGVEMVTVPASAYAYALRQIAEQEAAAGTVEQAGPVLNAEGMLDLLLSLHAAEVVSTGQLASATGLDHLDIGDRVSAFTLRPAAPFAVSRRGEPVEFVPPPEVARVDVTGERSDANAPEAHGAALDNGSSSEAHGAALAAASPERSLEEPPLSHEVPSNPVKSRHRPLTSAKDR